MADGSALDAAAPDGSAPAGALSIVRTGECSLAAWALGVLRKVPLAELSSASLTLDDVVWLDGVPAELPSAGGVLISAGPIPDALYLAAENAHVPLIRWIGTSTSSIEPLVDREIALTARNIDWASGSTPHSHLCEVHVDDLTGWLDPAERAEIQEARSHPMTASARALVIPRPVELCAVGQETTSVFALHRNKPRVLLTPQRTFVTNDTGASLHDSIHIAHRIGEQVLEESGRLSALPGASFFSDESVLRDEWSVDDPSGTYRFGIEVYRFEYAYPALLAGGLPLILYDQLVSNLVVTSPVAVVDPGRFGPESYWSIELWPCTALANGSVYDRDIDVMGLGRLTYDIELGGLPSRTYYSSPANRIRHVELMGLFAETISLDHEASVTAAVDHHNFSENIILEPARDPNVSPAVLQMLEAEDVKAMYFRVDNSLSQPNTVIDGYLQGFDGAWRQL